MNIILGTGPIGRSVMKHLTAQGKKVRMVNTSGTASGLPPQVEVVKCNLYDLQETASALRGATTVFQCAQPPYHRWKELFPSMMDSILGACAETGAKLAAADNLYMYGEVNEAVHEELPNGAQTKKGRVRAALSEKIIAEHRSGRVKAVLCRGSDYFGPGAAESIIGSRVFEQIVRGKPCTLLGNPDTPHSYTYIDDFGKALVTLSEQENTFGGIWHAPNVAAVTTRQLIEAAYRAAGHPPAIKVMSPAMLRIGALFIRAARESIEVMYLHEKPFIVNSEKITQQFGLHPTPLEQAIQQTVEWYRARARE
ncbi:NAD-dependent epimerase/dehydratase family protein [Paenibacillus turpanensis]|uniref:NAD-dependent epimerase/dehydratase family protein n=1 Tax=Paenibacillus turpanensis TaxID=2689078 RepID=UPI00140DD87D|nr:NAD-dependent epimerase/dehydratase family protein [Paenibacillus turpanensis]